MLIATNVTFNDDGKGCVDILDGGERGDDDDE